MNAEQANTPATVMSLDTRERDTGGNYIADDDTFPTTVWFANGRKVSIDHTEVKNEIRGGDAYLTIERELHPAFAAMKASTPVSDGSLDDDGRVIDNSGEMPPRGDALLDGKRLAMARECLRKIWQCFDTGGHSMGRSRQAVWLETAIDLLPYDGRYSDLADLKPQEFDQLRAEVRWEAGRERNDKYDIERGITPTEREPMGRLKIDCTMPDVFGSNDSTRRVAAVKGACARAAGFPKDAAHGYAAENAEAWKFGWDYCNDCLTDPAYVPRAITATPSPAPREPAGKDRLDAGEWQRLRDWAKDVNRKPAALAFTSGLLRDLADAVEVAVRPITATPSPAPGKDRLDAGDAPGWYECRLTLYGDEPRRVVRWWDGELVRYEPDDSPCDRSGLDNFRRLIPARMAVG